MTTYAVTGASGKLGRLVLAELLDMVEPDEIVALARDTSKLADVAAKGVEVRRADYGDVASLDAALAGVDRLLLISGNEVDKRVEQHQAVIDAAGRAGVQFIAYTSILHAPESPIGLAKGHRATEAALAASEVPHSLLRNGWYNENFTGALAAQIEAGVIYGSQGDGRISSAARDDYAIAAAQVLVNADGGEVLELAGDASWTMDDFAAELSKQSGKPVVYEDLPPEDYAALLETQGLPAPIAAMLADSAFATSKGALEDYSKTLSEIIGDHTIPVSITINQALANG
ncbi:MAG: SDR family oxidoreductase [Erythrobacter sp.]|nr:MAG: SDR family oxidoreductase [Erythrobacter sp.]